VGQLWLGQLLQVVAMSQVPTEQAFRVQLWLELQESSQEEWQAHLVNSLELLHLPAELQCFHSLWRLEQLEQLPCSYDKSLRITNQKVTEFKTVSQLTNVLIAGIITITIIVIEYILEDSPPVGIAFLKQKVEIIICLISTTD